MRVVRVINLLFLLCVVTGCSRSQKSGKSISAQDIAKAMPEFTLAATPGAVNLFLDSNNPTPKVKIVRFKMTVPRASVSNFLWASGFKGDFLPMPAGIFPAESLPLPGGLDPASVVSWAADVNSAAEWDLGRNKVPLRVTAINTFATGSPSERVMLTVFVDDSNSSDAPVYFQYFRVPKEILGP